MARYIGPTCRIERRYGKTLEFKTNDNKCKLNLPPGQHGQRRKRETEYGRQLSAKQALKLMYGMLEKQFRILYRKADRKKGATGLILLQFLESRLDNMVYRLGFGATRREARQLVSHKAILVNGKCVNIPSYHVKEGDQISVREKSKIQIRIVESVQRSQENGVVDWVDVDSKALSGALKRLPEADDFPSDINEQLVVELYSK